MTLGLTWKGIGEFLGRAAVNGEARLWDAELDLGDRLPLHGPSPPAERLAAEPWSSELSCDLPTKRHLRRYKERKDRWPDIDERLQGS